MYGKSLKKRVNLSLILFLFLGFSALVLGQEKQDNQEKQLRDEILSVYQAKGEQGLRDFVKKQKDKISNKFIVDFADDGVDERKKEWLTLCEIMAKEKKDKKTVAEILFRMGKYLIYISDHKTAMDYLSTALSVFIEENDLQGQANVYLGKGMIYYLTEASPGALEMFDKALPLFQKLKDYKGQGNIYLRKGIISSRLGDHSNAMTFYDKALVSFEKDDFYPGIGNVYNSKGNIFLNAGNYSNAHEMYNKAQLFFEKAGDDLGQGNVFQNRGDCYRITNSYPKALEMYDKALLKFKKINDLLGIGQSLLRKGVVYTIVGMNKKALESLNESLLFFLKADQPSGLGNVYQRIGDIYFYKGDNLKALEMYSKSVKFLKKAEDFVGIGNVLLRKGDIYLRDGNKSKALLMYGKAITSYKKVGEIRGQGIVFQRYGLIYAINGDYSKSLEQYEKAINVFEKVGDLLELANIYSAKGSVYFKTGNNSKAMEVYGKAITFYEKVGDPRGQGNVFENLGRIHFYTGNNIKALEMCDKALHFFEKAEEPVGQGGIYKTRGDIYSRIGTYSKALEMYDKAFSFFEKIGYHTGQGDIYRSKGGIYLYTEKKLNAMNMFDKALELYKKVGNQTGQGNVFGSMGELYFKTGDNSKALKMYENALIYFLKVGDLRGQSNIFKGKGDIFFGLGNFSEALDMYEKALLLYEKIGDIRSESNTLYGKAKIFSKLGKKSDAINLFERSILELEKYRSQTAIAELKKTLMEMVYERYEGTVLFMLENKFYDKVFKYAEAMRARVFLDQMAEGLVRLGKGLKPELKENRDKLVGKLSALSRQMQETGGKEEKKLLELKEEYRRVESQFENLLIKIRLDNPLYAAVNYPQPVSVRDLQKDVLKKGETVLSYFISLGKAYALIVSREKFRVKQLKVNEREINGYVDRYLHSIKENNANEMNRFGSKLYEKLFKPLEKYLKKSRDIIIVPSGKLETIPFESLIVNKKKQGRPVYLLEKYRIKYLQSASLLSILRKHYHRDSNKKSFIGFGDPVYDYENFKQGKLEQGSMKTFAKGSIEVTENSPLTYSPHSPHSPNSPGDEIKEIHRDRYARAGGIMDRLSHSGEEIKTIARLFEKESLKSAAHLREQATEENAKAPELKEFDYIHFSCHGLLNDDFQSLVLSQLPSDKSPEDGYFTLNEIMNCDYNAKLVVLSACQTGSGKMYKGEGVTGLTRAVMYAGTPAVVASLWKVDDTATKELMVKFYKNMLENNMDKVEALRQAKLELIKNKKYSSPLFWSAFVLYGE